MSLFVKLSFLEGVEAHHVLVVRRSHDIFAPFPVDLFLRITLAADLVEHAQQNCFHGEAHVAGDCRCL